MSRPSPTRYGGAVTMFAEAQALRDAARLLRSRSYRGANDRLAITGWLRARAVKLSREARQMLAEATTDRSTR